MIKIIKKGNIIIYFLYLKRKIQKFYWVRVSNWLKVDNQLVYYSLLIIKWRKKLK